MSNQPTKALLFLPDISGFTRFVNETEINHSSHIISELLEIIINENKLNMEVAEIEGDAVFFYKLDPSSKPNDILEQCKTMFIAFHAHLKRYEQERICQCGACTTASGLSLKFIAHYGDVLVQNINGRVKLMGKDVTYAHKLMKNTIDDNQYVLLSENILENNTQLSGDSWLELHSGCSKYEDIGDINYQYTSLSKLLSQIPDIPPRDRSHYISENPVITSTVINKPLLEVHAKLIDMSIRPEWRTKIGRVTDPIEKLGTIHDCILPNGTHLDIAVLDNVVEDGTITYKETTDGIGFFGPKSTEVFTLKEIENNMCELTSTAHLEISFLQKLFLKKLFAKGIKKSFKKFKVLCELQ